MFALFSATFFMGWSAGNLRAKDAEKQLAYIAGIRDMANAVIEAIEELGGK